MNSVISSQQNYVPSSNPTINVWNQAKATEGTPKASNNLVTNAFSYTCVESQAVNDENMSSNIPVP